MKIFSVEATNIDVHLCFCLIEFGMFWELFGLKAFSVKLSMEKLVLRIDDVVIHVVGERYEHGWRHGPTKAPGDNCREGFVE